jgi:5-methyltetrahydropteroyltriglutamate--homocysteine methyltransferase
MTIPTEPIGSIPRPVELIERVTELGDNADPTLEPLYNDAIRDTIERFEAAGSPVITDGEQWKYQNFWTYSVHGLPNIAPDAGGNIIAKRREAAVIRSAQLGTALASEKLNGRQ